MTRRRDRGFSDPVRTRHAVVLASVVGLARAGAQTGILPTQICTWRKRLERMTGERFPRLRRGAVAGSGKLSMEKARELRSRRARGVSWGVLARIYGVSPTACVKVWKHELYPDPAWRAAA